MFNSIWNAVFPQVELLPLVYDDEGYQVCFDGARRHKTLRMSEGEYTVRCQYSATHPFTNKGRKALSSPPLHWHRHQTEWFLIQGGTVGYEIDGVEKKASKGEVVEIKHGRIHFFWCDPTDGEDLILDITVRPAKGLDEQWFNSTYGYFESCYKKKINPPFWQVMASWYDADAVPGMVPKPIGLAIIYIFGNIAKWAGYKGVYPIYAVSHLTE